MSASKEKSIKVALDSAAIEADDLLTEILHRLPIRSIIRFKLVSTQWLSLLSNPVFCSLVRNPKLNPAAGMFVHWKDMEHGQRPGMDYISFSTNKQTPSPMKRKFNIVQSCNGLLLCRTGSKYHVYNPTTNMSITLPKPHVGVVGNGMKTRSMSLAFDPIISPYYKVICCFGLRDSIFIHIYSSDTRVWTSIPTEFKLGVNSKGVYWNGSIHWIYALTYFNIENQTLKQMPRPLEYSWRRMYYFGESCDCLHYAHYAMISGHDYSICVFELRRDYSSWDHKYTIDTSGNVGNFYYSFLVLSVVRSEKEEDSFLVMRTPRFEVMRYNLVSNASSELLGFPGRVCTHAFQYIASLSCV